MANPRGTIPLFRLCECGCGQMTGRSPAAYRKVKRPLLKGEPNYFIRGHQGVGRWLKPGGAKQFKHSPTEVPTEEDWAWFAGIFEGEGYVTGYRKGSGSRSPHRGFYVGVTQKDRWLLDRLSRLFGGGVYTHGKTGCFRWGLWGHRGAELMRAIYPRLSPRRQGQIDAALNEIPAAWKRGKAS